MESLSFYNTQLEGLILIKPFFAPDDRGFLQKSFEYGIFKENGITINVYENLTSFSKKGTLRGIHFQREHCQDKLVRVLHGEVFDVAVDLRKDSRTFGKWQGFYLSHENREMLYIPKGFGHGFLALEENTVLDYLCGSHYDADDSMGIIWNDLEINIQWPVEKIEKIIISKKDEKLFTFAQFKKEYGALNTAERKI